MFQGVEDFQILTFFFFSHKNTEMFVPWDEAEQELFYPLKI